MNPSTAFGTVLADELARCGLREVVIAPGSRSTPLAMAFDELDRAGRVRLHVRIDERSASFTALGLAKAARRPVAVVCTSGTAAANLHPAVIEADESAIPLLVLTADRPPELQRAPAPPDGGPGQAVRRSAVRWYSRDRRARAAAGYGRLLALAGLPRLGARGRGAGHPSRPGPPEHPTARSAGARRSAPNAAAPATHVSTAESTSPTGESASPTGESASPTAPALGADDWPESLAGRADGEPWTRVSAAAAVTEPLELRWAKRGVIVCGDGDYDAAALVALAELAGWPVLAEPSSGARRGRTPSPATSTCSRPRSSWRRTGPRWSSRPDGPV